MCLEIFRVNTVVEVVQGKTRTRIASGNPNEAEKMTEKGGQNAKS